MSDKVVAVGRAATPPPPNVGSSTLGHILKLGTDPRFANRRQVLGVLTPQLFERLAEAIGPVLPAVPGLAQEAISSVPVRCVIIDEDALRRGVWSGVLEKHAADLRDELQRFLGAAVGAGHPVYWLRRRRLEQPTGTSGTDGTVCRTDDAGLPEVPCPQALLVAPGSRMACGTEEGARPSLIVRTLLNELEQYSGTP